MAKNFNDETWREFVEKYSSYEGTVSSYCKENNKSKSQFYYYKKKFMQQSKPTFHAIVLNDEESTPKAANSNIKEHKDIRIVIGKANIFIPVDEISILSTILKELVKSC